MQLSLSPSDRSVRSVGILALVFGIAACQARAPAPDGARAAINVAPLQLPGVSKACWDVRVEGQGGGVVWQKGTPGQAPADKWPSDTGALCSDAYGSGPGGDIAYVGPCDASLVDDDNDGQPNDPNTNTVTLWLDGLYGASGSDPGDWRDPCPDGCQVDFDCKENADTKVDLNLTIMRAAQQGFFDIGVNFSDVFCSAKLDCKDALLHHGDVRDTTVVVAFACTAGQGGESTNLYLDDIVITCDGSPNAVPPVPPRTYTVTPSAATAGNHGALPPGVFQHATYFGTEDFQDIDKCYWNTAIGLDLANLEHGCRLELRGTAAGQPFTTPPFFHTPPDTVYPVIDWTVPLTDAGGALICGAHPLDGGNGVATTYTPFTGETFVNRYPCGGTPSTSRLTCDGKVSGVGDVVVGQTGDHVSVTAQGHTAYYPPLPSNLVIDTCCPDACCLEVTP
jgi:hypothetical protein